MNIRVKIRRVIMRLAWKLGYVLAPINLLSECSRQAKEFEVAETTTEDAWTRGYCCGQKEALRSQLVTLLILSGASVKEQEKFKEVMVIPVCPGCHNEIDPDVCHCGDECKRHDIHSGHSSAPLGCTCGYAKQPRERKP